MIRLADSGLQLPRLDRPRMSKRLWGLQEARLATAFVVQEMQGYEETVLNKNSSMKEQSLLLKLCVCVFNVLHARNK